MIAHLERYYEKPPVNLCIVHMLCFSIILAVMVFPYSECIWGNNLGIFVCNYSAISPDEIADAASDLILISPYILLIDLDLHIRVLEEH